MKTNNLRRPAAFLMALVLVLGSVVLIPKMTVRADETTGIVVTAEKDSMTVGETQTLTAEITAAGAKNSTVSWQSLNPNVATVDNGVVTAVAAGTATIVATASNTASRFPAIGQKTITVTDPNATDPSDPTDPSDETGTVEVTGVKVTADSYSMNIGETQTLTVTITPSNATNQKVTWSSSDDSIASVNQNGRVTAKAIGAVSIKATAEGSSLNVFGAVPIVVRDPDASIDDPLPDDETLPIPSDNTKTESETMYRLYNPNTSEHFYTSNAIERDADVARGWRYEGEAWTAPSYSEEPVYRLYNPNAGDHHYTMDLNEVNVLINLGWNLEGVGWYSASKRTGTPMYRLFNPYCTGAGAHHYTADQNEVQVLVSRGWQAEGNGWYGL